MFLIRSLSRLRTAPDFYPQLDFKKIYDLLKYKKYGIQQMNPALAGAIPESSVSATPGNKKRANKRIPIFFIKEGNVL